MSNEPNPFDDVNPFADPSIQRVTENVQVTQRSLDDYNPFSQGNFQTRPAAIIPTNNISPSQAQPAQTFQPQVNIPRQDPLPPAYTPTSVQQVNLTEIEKQQQELEKRAAELDRRERILSTPTGIQNNFPPLPSWCPGAFKPCFYQDITREIPLEFQKWVRLLFYLWIFHSLVLAFNIISAIVVMSTKTAYNAGATFGFSILFFFLFTPLSYVCWFRPAYKGFRNDSSVNFMLFFFTFFLQCIFSVISCFSDTWFCGIILLIQVLSQTTANNIIAGIFVLLTSIGFILIATADILMLIKIHRLYRNTGASFEKAQQEFASNMMSNKNVQNAAATVVTESARVAANQAAQTYGSPGRY